MMISLLLMTVLALQADAPLTDAGSEAMLVESLKSTQLKYDETTRFFKLRYTVSEGRQQVIFIRKKVETYNSLRVREVFSLCYESKDPPSDEVLQKMFLKRFSIGGMILEAPSEAQKLWRLRYRVCMPAEPTADLLKQFLKVMPVTADLLEKEFNSDSEDKL